MKRIFLGTDHAGFELKEKIKNFLGGLGYEVIDKGATSFNSDDDYPDFIKLVAAEVSADSKNNIGIILGKSGQGEAMTANRFKNVRAAVYYGGNPEIIKLSREHNNANILSLGAGFLSEEEAKSVVKIWLDTEFTENDRHSRRNMKIENNSKFFGFI